MSTNDQRKQWAEHIADEARALRVQQDAAGGTHAPTEGPLPYTADQLEAAIMRAVMAERQRCVAIAERWSGETVLRAAFGDFTERELSAAAAAARAVADEMGGARKA